LALVVEGDAALERDPIRGEAVLGEARSGLPFELAEDRGAGPSENMPDATAILPSPAVWPFRQVQLSDDLVRLAERRQRPSEKSPARRVSRAW
jgi:hypothetical protein